MASFYSKERAKYGNLTGQIIIWPVEYDGTPDGSNNARKLPAGYLKCDGTKYYADDYPRLAAVLGVGTSSKFLKRNNDGTLYDNIQDSQFIVPDLGSKYPNPTTGANAGVYNNIRLNNVLGTEVSRSGIGIEATSAIGTDVPITYSGSISVPSQEIDVRGKPGWKYAGDTHRTETEGVEENAIGAHAHYSTTRRSRLQSNAEKGANGLPKAAGSVGCRTASTINIDDWGMATTNGSNAPFSGQQTCIANDQWRPGYQSLNYVFSSNFFPILPFFTGYSNGCIQQGADNTVFRYSCINPYYYELGSGGYHPLDTGQTNQLNCNRGDGDCGGINGVPSQYEDGAKVQVIWNIFCVAAGRQDLGSVGDPTVKMHVTYAQGENGVPSDCNGLSLHDVLPLNSNQAVTQGRPGILDLRNEQSETDELVQTSDPTLHNHRIDIVKGDHNYRVKTNAIVIEPDNLSTTMTIGADASVSIDSAVQPFIVMEYLIKI